MHNSTNTCYLNAFFHALVWQVTTRTETRLPQAWLAALRRVNVKPLSLLRFFLLGWEQPHVQHDVAELASLLLRQLSWLPCVVSWSRRLQVEGGLQNLQAMQDSRIWHLDPSGGLQSSGVTGCNQLLAREDRSASATQPCRHTLGSTAQVCA